MRRCEEGQHDADLAQKGGPKLGSGGFWGFGVLGFWGLGFRVWGLGFWGFN